jgi:hypothetical protein
MTLGLSPLTSYSKQPGLLPSFIFHHFMALIESKTTSTTKDSKLAQLRNEEQEDTTLQSLKIQIFTTVPREHPQDGCGELL